MTKEEQIGSADVTDLTRFIYIILQDLIIATHQNDLNRVGDYLRLARLIARRVKDLDIVDQPINGLLNGLMSAANSAQSLLEHADAT